MPSYTVVTPYCHKEFDEFRSELIVDEGDLDLAVEVIMAAGGGLNIPTVRVMLGNIEVGSVVQFYKPTEFEDDEPQVAAVVIRRTV